MKGLSIRRNFAWNFVGNSLYNLAQWLLVVALAHLADPTVVGQFSLSLAITAPVFLAIGMNLRNSQATDAARRFQLHEYLTLRHILNAAAVVASVTIGQFLGLQHSATLVILAISGAKAVEALSQTYYGYFQQRQRLDLVSRSMLLRSVSGPALFLGAFHVSGELWVGALGLGAGWLLVQFVHDRRHALRHYRAESGQTSLALRPLNWRRLAKLAQRSAPLGVDAGLSSLSLNVPRYAVQSVLGASQLGVFASIAYLGQTVSMITSSMQAVILPRLAVLHHEGKRKGFIRLLTRLALFGLTITGTCVVGAAILGRQVLELLLPADYVRPDLLIALMVGAGLNTLQRSLCKGIEAAQRFRSYVAVDAITMAAVAAFAWPMTSQWGLLGAAWSLTAGFIVGCLAAAAVLARVVRIMPPSPKPVTNSRTD